MPRRHVAPRRHAHDQLAALPHVVVRQQREWRGLAGAVTDRAVAVDDRCDVSREGGRVGGRECLHSRADCPGGLRRGSPKTTTAGRDDTTWPSGRLSSVMVLDAHPITSVSACAMDRPASAASSASLGRVVSPRAGRVHVECGCRCGLDTGVRPTSRSPLRGSRAVPPPRRGDDPDRGSPESTPRSRSPAGDV